MNRVARFVLAALSVASASLASAPARADAADKAYPIFLAQDYATVFDQLFDYRTQHLGTLRVDFMLGVSACHMNSVEHRALGGYLLMQYVGASARNVETLKQERPIDRSGVSLTVTDDTRC